VPGITDPGLDEYQRRQMMRTATFAGEPLYRQGFWNVLMRVISGETYQLGVDAGGYNSTLSNWNAADAIPWYLSDFGVDPQYKGFQQGFQEVPKSLAALFRDAGGDIRLETPVQGFDWIDGRCELRVTDQTISAESLILAMPRRSLDLLAPTSPPLPEVQDLIASVTPRPLFKLFTTYSNPWWRGGLHGARRHVRPGRVGTNGHGSPSAADLLLAEGRRHASDRWTAVKKKARA
jgi:hypothetical protein